MKVVIAGSRDFNDYELLCKVADYTFQNQTKAEIASRTMKWADKLGEKYAEEKGYLIKPFPANWGKFGKPAGYIKETKKWPNMLMP